MEIIFLISSLFLVMFVWDFFSDRHENKVLKTQLMINNKQIIFVNNSNMNIKEECYQPEAFFHLHNTGDDPCGQIESIDYKAYSKKEDYYIK